ncbi:MAG: substrate-binding domain-containing protein [Muribaculaceae bacterium]|nr:substrate-binding domain-containing protein [Roseburia sp.]MCM1430152.1 substrate-binding domain-containing protein [Muribaculaceae bacterium]MCM1493083.1 substrate-binding domain-containing protein [Muribaculaceae bacterium]
MAKAVKLADIAEIVGVSTVTVSKALSDQKGVSEELRERIKQLAAEMGYRPPAAGRNLESQKQYTIGVLIQEIYLGKYVDYYWKLYQELTKKAVARGSFTLLEMVSRKAVLASEMPMMLKESRVDGIVVVGSMEKPYLLQLEEHAGVPIVYMDYYDNERPIDTVIPNSFYGSYMLTNYLFDMGHRKIAYLGTLCATNSITDRYLGYVKSLLEHGEPLRGEWVLDDRDSEGTIDLERLLTLPEQMPTAFVCNCDVTASYLVKYLTRRGYRVPEDVSLVGFDNYLYPGVCDIGITTYEVDIGEMARRTLHKIIRKIANEKYTAGAFIVDGRPVYKDSVIPI